MIQQEKRLIPNEELFTLIEETLRENYQAEFTVTGNSMWPLLRHGRDRVIVESCAAASLKTGDVVLLRAAEGRYLLHRVTALRGDCFETTGDGNCFRDGFFPRDRVIARVVRVIRKGKTLNVTRFYWQPVFRLWMALFPVRGRIMRAYARIRGKAGRTPS